MKLFSKIIAVFSISFGLLIFTQLEAQNFNTSTWSKKLNRQKSFIENKGQFIIPNSFNNISDVLFAVDNGGTKIYFTKKGITYTFLETKKKYKDDREMAKERLEEYKDAASHERFEKEERELKIKADQVTMVWENANPNVDIQATELTSDYHNYSFKNKDGQEQNVSNVKGYQKITYKNIYPNIDIEYVFEEKGGLKYALTLHPGADPSTVKMVYDNSVTLKSNGEIHIDTKFGDIIDHSPLTFYESNKASLITSKFMKVGKTVSFHLDNYDNTQTVIIDPWTQTPAFATNWDCVWECEKDAAGNVYIIGGVMPMQLIKYNAAGAIQWTYNTPYDTSNCWLGTFATDNIGNSYVTRGSTSGIQKISTAGTLIWNNNGGGGSTGNSDEYWNISFNCDQTKLIVGGTTGAFGLPPVLKGAIFDINTTNGAILATKTVAYGSTLSFPPSIQEVRSITSCGNGKYYFLTLDSIGFINQNFGLCGSSNAAIFKTTSTHGFSYKCENFRYDNSGIMAIRADLNFVYTHNGTTLFKRSLANASIIASVPIPGGAATTSLGQKAVSCSGIDIDANGNIYVGSTNAVTKFSPALVQLGTVAVPFNVYDVHVSTSGDVIACGSTGNSGTSSRTGYIQSISSLVAGNSLSLTCCDANICQPVNQCLTSPAFNLVSATAGGIWSGTGITNTVLGTFNPAVAGVGSFVVTYSLACGVGTTTVNVSACGTVTLCVNSGSITASGGAGTYTWSSTTTSVNCSACPGGSCIPFICAGTTVPTWTASGSTVAAPSGTVFPIKVTDVSSGVTFTFTTLASLPPCTITACPTLTMSVASQTNVNCFGASTGTAAVSTSGGAGPYTYTWSPGGLTGTSQTALSAGTYTIAIKDANLCPGTGLLTITQPTSALSAVISATTAASCVTSSVSIFWTENFGVGCNQGALASVFTGTNGAWAVTATGLNDADANEFYVSATEAGMGVGVCGDGCLGAGTTNRTLHIANVSTSPAAFFVCPTGDCGAAYDAGFGSNNVTADKRAESPTINCSSQTNITLKFNYIEGGQTTIDNATLWYFNGTVWAQIDDMPKTVVCGGGQGTWASRTIVLPSSADNNPNIKVGFRWVNNDDGVGADPSFALDDITLSSASGSGALGGATVTASGGTPIYSYSWSPSGGTTAGVSNLPAGNNTVTVTDTKGCIQSAIATITSAGGPTVTVNSATICSGSSAIITASGATTYSWSAGLSATTGATVSANPAVTTVYTVTGTTGGCSSAAIFTVSVSGTPTITPNSYTTCPGGSATLTANGAVSYTWSPAGTLSSSTGSVVIATPSTSTNYTVVGANGTCTSSATSSVTIGSGISLTANSATICSGTNTTLTVSGANSYTWSPSGTLSSANGASVIATPTVNTTYTITGTSGVCSGSTTVLVTVNVLPTVTVNSPTICSGSSVVLIASGATSYTWSTTATTNSISVTPTTTANFTVVGANGSCVSQAVATVNVYTTTVINYSNIFNSCPNQPIAISAATTNSAASTYTWSNGASTFSQTVVPNTTTIYNAVGSAANGCLALSSTITVNVNSIAANFSGLNALSAIVGSNLTLTNTSTGATNFVWKYCNGGVATTSLITIPLNTIGNCCVTLIASNASCIDSITKCIEVISEASVNIPNVFTPNGDNINDVFTIQSSGLKSLRCSIFNRWGTKLYEWDGLTGSWDGRIKGGGKAPSGTYFFIVDYISQSDISKTEKGFLSLFNE